jgi:hypothetical protein
MSQRTESRQRGLSGFGDPPEHLSRDHLSAVPPENGVKLDADPSKQEAWCLCCDNRVTVGADEYGHEKTCEHSCWEPKQ